MAHQRWLLEMKAVPASDEAGFEYQLYLTVVDTSGDHVAVAISNVDELYDALFQLPVDGPKPNAPPIVHVVATTHHLKGKK